MSLFQIEHGTTKLYIWGANSTTRTAFLVLAALYFFLLFSTPIMAQTPDAEVDFFVVPPEGEKPYTVGDHIVLRLEDSSDQLARRVAPTR